MRFTHGLIVATLTTAIFGTVGARANTLTDLEIFERCFKRMVNDIPASTDPLWMKVQAGTVKGPAACLQLFDKAKIGANEKIAAPNDPQARAVIKSFNDFHGSWFQQRVTDNGQGQQNMAFALIADLEEPQLFLTRALLGGKQYKSIVTEKISLQGVRERTAGMDNATAFNAQRLLRYPNDIPELSPAPNDFRLAELAGTVGATIVPIIVPDVQMTQVGALIGIQEATIFKAPYVRGLPVGNAAQAPVATNAATLIARNTASINENFGAGIVGSPVFIVTNSNIAPAVHPTSPKNEIYNINRVMAARVYEDLLCHDLPTLTEDDVKALVQPSSLHAFHKNASCMVCHAQIDPYASVYRNIVQAPTIARLQKETTNHTGFAIYALATFPVDAASPAYVQSAPEGQVRFRPFRSNKPVVVNVTSINQIGDALADSKDLYECAAKRYYQFFTGIDIPLRTIPAPAKGADVNTVNKYKLDIAHQKFVLTLAVDLQKNQNLRTMVSTILNSGQYRTRDYQSAVEAK